MAFEDLTAAIESRVQSRADASHLIIQALAGTGKTTTLVQGLAYMLGKKPAIEPSEQQLAIWEELAKSKVAASDVCFVAFNKSIATELQRRVPAGCNAMTMHSMGLKSVTQSIGRRTVDGYAASEHLCVLMDTDMRELRRKHFEVIRGVDRLVSLCKMNLTGYRTEPLSDDDVYGGGYYRLLPEDDPQWHEELEALASHHDLELNGSADRVFEMVPRVLHRCLDVANVKTISFDDMIWLPVVLNLPVTRYGLLLVDESQDTNRCQQALALRVGDRLGLCGDNHQAIYGFAGADANSMQHMQAVLESTDRGCTVLPLTVTRRCGRAIVKEAQAIVPEFEAHVTNCDGLVSHRGFGDGAPKTVADDATNYRSLIVAGDMAICRVNAPLVSECFKFIKQGIRAEIQGRDIGKGLISLVKKMKATSVEDLIAKITDWEHQEVDREQKKRTPSETRIISIQDRAACVNCFSDDAKTVDDVIQRIDDMFTDSEDNNAIRFSSIHKAKGLEADRVFLLEPGTATVPHPMAKSAWQREQEWNLRYVAITRAIKELVYVK